MEQLNNIVSLDDLNNKDLDDGMSWDDYLDGFKGEIFKGAIFARKNDGSYIFVCTEDNKIGQERLLYHLQDIIRIYIAQYPDFEVMKETASLIKVDFDDMVAEMYEEGMEDD